MGKLSTVFLATVAAVVCLATASNARPDFGGKNHQWVAGWNVPSYFAETGECDGIAWDGHLVYNGRAMSSKVYFTYDGVRRFHAANALSMDPRRTAWWMTMHADSAGTLWESVEFSACSQDHPDVTRAIIDDMVRENIVNPNEIGAMTSGRISRAMRLYTDLVYHE